MWIDNCLWILFKCLGRGIFMTSGTLLIIVGNYIVNCETNLTLPETFQDFYLHNGIIRTKADYDGDGLPDKVRWAKNEDKYEWSIWNKTQNDWYRTEFGHEGDIPVMGDYNGDGVYDFAVWTPDTGTWSYHHKADTHAEKYGSRGDVPMNGDYTGDGVSDYALWRPSDATFYVKDGRNHSITIQEWGSSTNIPISGDYNFDRITDFVVWDEENGNWNIYLNGGNGERDRVMFGQPGDIPVSGDFTEDGYDDYVVFRQSDYSWHIRSGKTGEVTTVKAAEGQSGRSAFNPIVEKSVTLEPQFLP